MDIIMTAVYRGFLDLRVSTELLYRNSAYIVIYTLNRQFFLKAGLILTSMER